MGEFRMPILGADMEAGTLVEWVKHPGDAVRRGDILAVVDTQKGAIEIEAFEDGVLESARVNVGDKVPVGTVLAVIGGAADGSTRPRASPSARHLAAELAVDLVRVSGTGPGGAIQRADVERAAAAGRPVTPAAPPSLPSATPSPRPQPDQAARGAAIRAAIAAAMSRSKREIPHYYLSHPIDMSVALAWLRAGNETRPIPERLLPAVLLVKAVALALHDVPELNGYWTEGAFRPGSGIHVGCAVSLRTGGLVAPAIHDADRADLGTLMRALRDLTARARAGTLRSSELADATITVTSLGDQGVEAAYGIIYPPQVALVGFGRIADRPWSVDGRVESRPALTATLAADHRASDGHRGGLFLAAIARRLQAPQTL